MVWSRWVEDVIWRIFYRYDLKNAKEQQEKLKQLCMHEINTYRDIKEEIKNNRQLEYFIIQVALENIGK